MVCALPHLKKRYAPLRGLALKSKCKLAVCGFKLFKNNFNPTTAQTNPTV